MFFNSLIGEIVFYGLVIGWFIFMWSLDKNKEK